MNATGNPTTPDNERSEAANACRLAGTSPSGDGGKSLTVVVPTLGRMCLLDMLRSLAAVEGFEFLDVLVCGAVTDDFVRSRLAEMLVRYPQIRNPPESAAMRALHEKRNLGWRLARTDVVAYLDDDVVLEPQWAARILDPFADPQVGLVSGPGLIPPDLALMPRLAGLALASQAMGHLAARYRSAQSPRRDIRWSKIIGCNMAIRRCLLEEEGGFNPFFEAGDEMFVSHAIWKRGYRIVFASEARAYHYPRSTLGGFLRQIYGYGDTRVRLFRNGVEPEWLTLAPALLVASVAVLGVLSVWSVTARWLIAGELTLYFLVVLWITLRAVVASRRLEDALLMLLIPLMHAVYGWAEWKEVFLPRRHPL